MNKSIFQVSVIAGVGAALACFLYILFLQSIGQNPFGQYKFLYFGIYGIFFVLPMQHYRNRYNGYTLRGHEGIVFGFVLNTVSSLLYGASLALFMSRTETGAQALEMYKAAATDLLVRGKEYLTESGTTDEQQKELAAAIQALSAHEFAYDQAIGMFMVGTLLTFLFMLMLKTSNKEPELR